MPGRLHGLINIAPSASRRFQQLPNGMGSPYSGFDLQASGQDTAYQNGFISPVFSTIYLGNIPTSIHSRDRNLIEGRSSLSYNVNGEVAG